MEEAKQRPRPTSVYSGNPRVTVAFPFARIEVHEPVTALADLAGLLSRLAEQVAQLTRAVTDDGEEADRLADEAKLLAMRLGAEGVTA
jgi:hypothetical protein